MKKLFRNLLFFSAIGSVAILASCGGDEEEPLPAAPSITVTVSGDAEVSGSEITAITGDEVSFAVTITAPGVFNTLNITPSVDGVAGTPTVFTRNSTEVTKNADNTEASITITYTFEEEDEDTEITWTFEAVDDSDQTATKEFTATVSAPPSPEARAYTAVLLSAPLGDKSADGFFSSNTGLVYSPADVTGTSAAISPNIDFGYYYGATDKASLASPKAYSLLSNAGFTAQVAGWGTLNETMLKKTTLTAAAFTEVTTWADLDEVYTAATDAAAGVKTTLEANQVLAFKTASTKTGGSKIGLILVKSITAGDGVAGKIELEILVQEDAE
ncbi:hypothetical protein [uncultured Imperialibacter sp.]|uniref:hypothetical protein n=1 Tax=uncultured Imperialibacter sp. TaxID=1672639 RepID=UPI0030DC0554|tara:strand:+ start:3380 stop:4366 length:987 start_codon:yes stop_codon:yes gene_type:complete